MTHVNDSAITVIMIRGGPALFFSSPPPSIWSLNKYFGTREMAPFGPVVARIRMIQEPINQLQYNRRECQLLVDHVKAFIASLEEKSYVQNLLDLQQKLLEYGYV